MSNIYFQRFLSGDEENPQDLHRITKDYQKTAQDFQIPTYFQSFPDYFQRLRKTSNESQKNPIDILEAHNRFQALIARISSIDGARRLPAVWSSPMHAFTGRGSESLSSPLHHICYPRARLLSGCRLLTPGPRVIRHLLTITCHLRPRPISS